MSGAEAGIADQASRIVDPEYSGGGLSSPPHVLELSLGLDRIYELARSLAALPTQDLAHPATSRSQPLVTEPTVITPSDTSSESKYSSTYEPSPHSRSQVPEALLRLNAEISRLKADRQKHQARIDQLVHDQKRDRRDAWELRNENDRLTALVESLHAEREHQLVHSTSSQQQRQDTTTPQSACRDTQDIHTHTQNDKDDQSAEHWKSLYDKLQAQVNSLTIEDPIVQPIVAPLRTSYEYQINMLQSDLDEAVQALEVPLTQEDPRVQHLYKKLIDTNAMLEREVEEATKSVMESGKGWDMDMSEMGMGSGRSGGRSRKAGATSQKDHASEVLPLQNKIKEYETKMKDQKAAISQLESELSSLQIQCTPATTPGGVASAVPLPFSDQSMTEREWKIKLRRSEEERVALEKRLEKAPKQARQTPAEPCVGVRVQTRQEGRRKGHTQSVTTRYPESNPLGHSNRRSGASAS